MPPASSPSPPTDEARRIVAYWRASLADGARQDIDARTLQAYLGSDDGPYAVERELLQSGVVPDPGQVARIVREGRRARGDDEGTTATCQVLVCPLVARAAVVHGRRRASDDFVVPLYVPAVLAADGTLSPPSEGGPWIPRDRLEPGRDTRSVTVGSADAVDRYLSTHDAPDAGAGWGAYWRHAWEMLEAVARDAGWRPSPEGFDPGALGLARHGAYASTRTGFVLPRGGGGGMVGPLLEVYEQVLGGARVPPLLSRLAGVEPRRQEAPPPPEERPRRHALHLGQMSDRHALARSQREALHEALVLEEGDLLAINGPPGTGKTTLLQSVVASLWVRAALEEREPPVVVAVSTNNQAVTNVIESFGKAEQHPSPLVGRWLPDVVSYGLFCASQKRREGADAGRFQVASERGEGFPAAVENEAYVARATAAFLARAAEAFGRPFADVQGAVRHLHAQLEGCEATLRRGAAAREALLRARAEAERRFGTVDIAPLVVAAREEAEALEREIRDRRARAAAREEELRRACAQRAAEARARGDSRLRPWTEIRDRWEAFERATPAWIVLLSWLPPVREHRRALLRRFLRALAVSPPADVRDPAEVDGWIAGALKAVEHGVETELAGLHGSQADALAAEHRELRQFEAPREAALAGLDERLRALAEVQAHLRPAAAAWEAWVAELAEEALHSGNHDPPRPTSEDALEVADRLIRLRAFQLATHYWEGRWLAEMRQQIDSGYRETRGRAKQVKRWRRQAKLTPCMVSTLYKAPSFFSCWEGERGRPAPLLSFVDLLIVDEAGQVPPELAGAAFALAKRALVVGDTEQLRPVWRVSAWVDAGNLRHARLAETEEARERVHASGITAAGGSAMRLAQRRSRSGTPGFARGGMLLTEHYRCAPAIISYCNELCYEGRLRPVRAADVRPPLLPRMGYAHVPGASRRIAGSRDNPVEAEAVAQWIADHAEALRRLGARARGADGGTPLPPLERVVAVVTPFAAQARAIRRALAGRQERGLTVDTVHALQGDERDVVVFSPVYSRGDGGSRYMLQDRSLLNVAVSRARESFLVFGDMAGFDPREASPAGMLARHLFAAPEHELTDVQVHPAADAGVVRKLAGTPEHQEALRRFFADARETIRVTSPWITARAVREDGIDRLVADAVARGVRVTCYLDVDLTGPGARDQASAAEGKRLLVASGATVRSARRIHNKTVTVDDRLICEGSFNWLSAVRRPESPFHRYERSLVYAEGAERLIQRFVADVERRVVRTLAPGTGAGAGSRDKG